MLKNLGEAADFMENEWLASLATVDNEGNPHVVPVWFTYDKVKVHVQTDRKSVKIRNIKRNCNVAMAVYKGEQAVIIRGKASVVDDEERFREWTQRHIDKYNRLFNVAYETEGIEYIKLDAHGRDSMGIPLFDSKVRCVIEVTPEKVRFW